VNEIIKSLSWNIQTERVKPFYDKNEFIEAWVPNSKLLINEFKSDHLLLSFHGLPERHVKATDLTKKHCLQSENCCEKIVDANANCYRAQCFATSKAIALKLNLKPSDYTVSFQSRLGTTPWIKPYTDFIYADLIKLGKKRLVVMCPAFIADCLETLEGIGIRGRQQFKGLGGEDLLLIPSLNSDESWVQGAAKLIKSQTTTC
jgi:ferrochelatase